MSGWNDASSKSDYYEIGNSGIESHIELGINKGVAFSN